LCGIEKDDGNRDYKRGCGDAVFHTLAAVIAGNPMDFSGHRGRHVARSFEKGHGLDGRRQERHIELAQHHRQNCYPGPLGDGQFGQRVTAIVNRVGADQKYEQAGLLNRGAYTVVVLLPRRQVGAVKKNYMPLIPQNEINRFGVLLILRRVT
jgi:hypothetical protein